MTDDITLNGTETRIHSILFGEERDQNSQRYARKFGEMFGTNAEEIAKIFVGFVLAGYEQCSLTEGENILQIIYRAVRIRVVGSEAIALSFGLSNEELWACMGLMEKVIAPRTPLEQPESLETSLRKLISSLKDELIDQENLVWFEELIGHILELRTERDG